MSAFDKDFAATVLVESAYTTDDKVCEKYGISTKTLQRYRKILVSDSELSSFVHTKKKAFDEAWADEMPVALKKALLFIGKATEVADARNPMVIESIVGAIKIIAEVQMTGKLIDARIAQTDRPQDSIPGQGDTTTEVASQYKN